MASNLAATIFFGLKKSCEASVRCWRHPGNSAGSDSGAGSNRDNAAKEETNATRTLTSGETNALAAASSDTNAQETLRAYLQLQEQLHLTQLAVEQNRREASEMAAQNSEALAGRLQTIEKALESQRTRELEAMRSSNRAMLWGRGDIRRRGFPGNDADVLLPMAYRG